MPQNQKYESKEVQRAAAENEKQPDVAAALGTNVGQLSYYLRTSEEFREAYNRGRTKGGFALYQPRGQESSSGKTQLREAVLANLPEDAREVLDAIETAGKPGISAGDIEINCEMSTARVNGGLQILQTQGLVHLRGAKFVLGAWPTRGDVNAAPDPVATAPGSDLAPPRKPQAKAAKTNEHKAPAESARSKERQRRGPVDRRLRGDRALRQGHGAGARGVALSASAR